MTAIRVLHVTPVDWRNRPWGESRMAELRRLFGSDVEVYDLSPIGRSIDELLEAARTAGVDAVVMASGERSQVRAVQDLVGELLVLRPVYREVRSHRGEVHQQWTGFGLLRGVEPVLLADKALAEHSAVAEALALQRARQ